MHTKKPGCILREELDSSSGARAANRKLQATFTHCCLRLLIDWTVKITCTQENVNFNLPRSASEEK